MTEDLGVTEKAALNIRRAGEFFILSIWLQSQMADLLLLENNPSVRAEFLRTNGYVPRKMIALRASLWEKDFSEISRQFSGIFSQHIQESDLKDLDAIKWIRNAIAHSHVSVKRDVFLYRPRKAEAKEEEFSAALNLKPVKDAAEPTMLSLHFYDSEAYQVDFDRLTRINELIGRIAASLEVPHARIQ